MLFQATEEQIEQAGGRPQKPEAGGVLTGYKKVKTSLFEKLSFFALFEYFAILRIYLHYSYNFSTIQKLHIYKPIQK